jgi:hypothetical protein
MHLREKIDPYKMSLKGAIFLFLFFVLRPCSSFQYDSSFAITRHWKYFFLKVIFFMQCFFSRSTMRKVGGWGEFSWEFPWARLSCGPNVCLEHVIYIMATCGDGAPPCQQTFVNLSLFTRAKNVDWPIAKSLNMLWNIKIIFSVKYHD